MSAWPVFAPHQQALAPLRHALSQGRMHHAHLWSGREGIGKFALAESFARELLCLTGGGAPDCTCRSCSTHAQHPDRLVLGPDPAALKIEPVRLMLSACAMKPSLSQRRVVIVRDAHEMTPQAQNAFLKTLEEPPGATFFILVTHRERALLRTIRSRCQQLRFAPLDQATLRSVGGEALRALPPATQNALVDAATGSASDLLALLAPDQDGPAPSARDLFTSPIRDRLTHAERFATSFEATTLAATRYACELLQLARSDQPKHRARALALLKGIEQLLAQAEGNGNRRLLWERWLMS